MTIPAWFDDLVGMRCTCAPGCTTGDTWGDGPRQCDEGCQPCRVMAGRPYEPPPKTKG